MDAFFISFLLCLIVESAGKSPVLASTLCRRYAHGWGITLGIALGLGANAGIAAVAGSAIAGLLTSEARDLFFAFALGASGVGVLFTGKRIDTLEKWKLGPLFTGALGLFILGFGESAPFLIAGVAAARADPWMAGTGGWAGTMTACLVLPQIMGARFSVTCVKALRIIVAIILMMTAFFLAMGALRLL